MHYNTKKCVSEEIRGCAFSTRTRLWHYNIGQIKNLSPGGSSFHLVWSTLLFIGVRKGPFASLIASVMCIFQLRLQSKTTHKTFIVCIFCMLIWIRGWSFCGKDRTLFFFFFFLLSMSFHLINFESNRTILSHAP